MSAHRDVLRLMQARDWPAALDAIDAAIRNDSANPRLLLHQAQCLLALGRRPQALAVADAAERLGSTDPLLLDAIGTLRSYGNDHSGALAACDKAAALAPLNASILYNRATVRRFLGDLEGAEADYDRAIALKPLDYEAYLNRSELRTQSALRNHIVQLERLLARGIPDWRGEVRIRYALAKESEDVGQYAESFDHLRRGAKKRREHMNYDIATDVATAQWIADAFPGTPAVAQGIAAPNRADAPVFVVGLPRSGTTLVERILGSHSTMSSAGELDCFALALVEAVRRHSGRAKVPREELVALSAQLDFKALGEDYLVRARAAFRGAGRFIDKMPLNYLYCGLIRRALPNAKIVHLTRHPMAVGYAMYKTLFKDGYPFSYDLDEIGRYYLAYRQLMAHWRVTMPGVIHELSYEDLVADQIGETRKLLAFCGLGWEEGCVAFHENPQPSTTASASQVRRPIYDSSVSQWRCYEQQLTELRHVLTAAGVSV